MFQSRSHLISTFFLFLLSLFVVVLHIGLVTFFLHPFNKINLISLFVIIILLMTESGKVVWLSFVSYFLVELFSITPFGVVLYSGTISALVSFWLYKGIFTNRTVLTTMSLATISIVVYRFFYSVLLFIDNHLSNKEGVSFSLPLSSYAWELVTTVITAVLIHILLKFFVVRLNTAKIKK